MITLTLIALSTLRIVRLIQEDSITERLRESIWMISPKHSGYSYYKVPKDDRWKAGSRALDWTNPLFWIERRYMYHEKPDGPGYWRNAGFWGQVIACRSCLSIWAAAAAWLLTYTPAGLPLLFILSASEVTIIIRDVLDRLTDEPQA